MNALQELIRTRMSELNRSYGDIARRSGLPRSTVHHLASSNRPVRVPNPRTLERLAIGLEVPQHVVRAAAAAAAGFVLDEQSADDPEIEVLVASLARLTPEDRRHVSALIRSMLEAPDRDGAAPERLSIGNKKISASGRHPCGKGAHYLGWGVVPPLTFKARERHADHPLA